MRMGWADFIPEIFIFPCKVKLSFCFYKRKSRTCSRAGSDDTPPGGENVSLRAALLLYWELFGASLFPEHLKKRAFML